MPILVCTSTFVYLAIIYIICISFASSNLFWIWLLVQNHICPFVVPYKPTRWVMLSSLNRKYKYDILVKGFSAFNVRIMCFIKTAYVCWVIKSGNGTLSEYALIV